MGKIIFPTEMAQCHMYMNDNLRSVNNTVFITFILYIQATLNKVLLGTIFLCSCTKNLFFFFFNKLYSVYLILTIVWVISGKAFRATFFIIPYENCAKKGK